MSVFDMKQLLLPLFTVMLMMLLLRLRQHYFFYIYAAECTQSVCSLFIVPSMYTLFVKVEHRVAFYKYARRLEQLLFAQTIFAS